MGKGSRAVGGARPGGDGPAPRSRLASGRGRGSGLLPPGLRRPLAPPSPSARGPSRVNAPRPRASPTGATRPWPQLHLGLRRRPLARAGSPRRSEARTGARPPPRPAPAPRPSPARGEGGHTCGWRSLLDTVLPDRRGPGSGRAQGAGLGRERSARGREGRHHGENFTAVSGRPPRACCPTPGRTVLAAPPPPPGPGRGRPQPGSRWTLGFNPDRNALTHHLVLRGSGCEQVLLP